MAKTSGKSSMKIVLLALTMIFSLVAIVMAVAPTLIVVEGINLGSLLLGIAVFLLSVVLLIKKTK